MMRYYRRSVDPRHEYRRWIDPRVRTLRLEDVIAYLQRRGWRELPPDRKGVRAFQEPTGEVVDGHPVCQFVPDSEAHDTYGQRMFELITGLAEFEDRQATEVIDDIVRQRASPTAANGPAVPTSAQPATP
jgi:hypothetical protein